MSGHDHGHCIAQALARADQLCQTRGVRFTDLRRRVFTLVWSSHEAIKAYDILEQLGGEFGPAKPPTVYRALDFLLAQGLIHKIESRNAYIGCSQPEAPHVGHMLICQACGDVSELAHPAITQAIADCAAAVGFTIHHQTIEIEGTCAGCRAQELGSGIR